MAKVRILHVGGVGVYAQGEVVEDAHDGLVEIATKGIRNAADGELVAEIVEDEVNEELAALRETAKELGVKGYANMKRETLEAKIAEVQAAAEAAQLAEQESARKAAEEAERLAAEEVARLAAEEAAKNAGNQ